MSDKYLSRRSGSTQWLLQRISAALLVVMAFGHFFLQHFTKDAVSTGLTVAFRLNDPWWQSYYVVFVALALFHGTNGLIGILRDYAPPARWRFLAETVLWTVVALFGARAIINIANPVPTSAVKELYTRDGFPAGATNGNPPGPSKTYDFRDEVREMRLFEYYLVQHTHRTESTPVTEIFGHQAGEEATKENLAAVTKAFDKWLLATIADPGQTLAGKNRSRLFSSSYEFAVWAKEVRRTNATLRSVDGASTRAAVLLHEHLGSAPAYSASLH